MNSCQFNMEMSKITCFVFCFVLFFLVTATKTLGLFEKNIYKSLTK